MNKTLNKITQKMQSNWNDYNKNASKEALLDIISTFHIPIDDKRLEDYKIDLELLPLKLRVIDNKEQTFCESTIKNSEENMQNGYIVETTSRIAQDECPSSFKQIKKTYFNSDLDYENSIPFKEELILPYGNLQISYKTDISGIPLDQNNKTSITYSMIDDCEIYPIFEYTILKNLFTPHYTSSFISYLNNINGATIDTKEEISSNSNNLIYTVEKASNDNLNIRGICFFKSDIPYSEKQKTVPFGFNLNSFPELFDPEVTSSIMFDGISPESFYNTLTITKNKEKIKAEYLKTLEKETYEDELDEENIYNECYSVEIPSTSKGSITEEELSLLREKMLLEWPNSFVSFVDSKLEHFQNLIAEYKGQKEKEDPFMLDHLFLYPISTADELIEKNKDSYFATLNNICSPAKTTTKDKKLQKIKK